MLLTLNGGDSMPKKYTAEERELIDLVTEISAIPDLSEASKGTDRVAELILKNMGNKAFNKKLRAQKYGKNVNETNAIEFLSAFTHKTADYNHKKVSSSKLDVALKSQFQNQPLEEYEKLTLFEHGEVSALASVHKKYKGLIGYIVENSDNKELKEMAKTLQNSSSMMVQLEKKALNTGQYKSGDLAMYLTPKTTAIKGKNNQLTGHEGKLEEAFLTKYNHAAPLYVDDRDPEKSVITKSDIVGAQRSDEFKVNELLGADTFRIDPVKMVSKKQAKKLEQVDYGYKQGPDGQDLVGKDGKKEKQTWQNVMRERYEQLSHALHVEQAPHQLHEMDLKKVELEENLSDLMEIEVLERTENENDAITYLQEESLAMESRIKDLEGSVLNNDISRLESVTTWAGPAAVVKGHTKWFGDNSVREMSQKRCIKASNATHKDLYY